MRVRRYLQHWFSGQGLRMVVADFVPKNHPLRIWADTFPWAALVVAIDNNVARRFPSKNARGRPPVSPRVLLALELLKHELACSDEHICQRLRTDFAVMYACGITEVQIDASKEYSVLPEVLATFRSRINPTFMDELGRIQAVAATEAGLVSPAHVVSDTFPAEQGSQRVTDAPHAVQGEKKALRVIGQIAGRSARGKTALKTRAEVLHDDLTKIMRRFGRQCRGQSRVFLTLVRETKRHFLEAGQSV